MRDLTGINWVHIFKSCMISLILFSCHHQENTDLNKIDFSFESCVSDSNQPYLNKLSQIQFLPKQQLNLGFFRGSIWIKVKLINHNFEKKEVVILNNDKINRNYRFYKLDADAKTLIPQNLKENNAFADGRSYNFVYPNFKITLKPQSESTYYRRVLKISFFQFS